MEETPKERRRDIDERHYLIFNGLMLIVFVYSMILIMLADRWPIDQEAAVTVQIKTAEPCYVAILSTDTDRYGVFVRKSLFGEKSVDSIEETEEYYWAAVQDAGTSRGLTEEKAQLLVKSKQQELATGDGKYSYEMYRELVQYYLNRQDLRFLLDPEPNPRAYAPYEVWTGIAAYEDPDGYRFVHQNAWVTTRGDVTARWYALLLPGQFKVLLYWPESGRYAVSGVLERKQSFSEFRVTVETLPGETVEQLQVEDVSRSEAVPLWAFLAAFVVMVGLELLIALACGAKWPWQLKIIATVSAAMHVLLFLVAVLTCQVCLYEGTLRMHYTFFVLAKIVVIPVLEMPLYVWLLRAKDKHAPKYKFCDFTLFINWLPVTLTLLLAAWLQLI